MNISDVDTLCAQLRAKGLAQIDSMEAKKSVFGTLFGSNDDITKSQDSIRQLVASPGDANYQAGLASNISNLQTYGESVAGDPTGEAKFQSIAQLVADQIGYGSVAIQYSTATAIATSTFEATAQQIKDDAPSVPELAFGLGAVSLIALAVVAVVAYAEFGGRK